MTFFVQYMIKQLLGFCDTVILIFRIIKVYIRVIFRLQLITPTLIIVDITKTSSNTKQGLSKGYQPKPLAPE